MRCRDQNYRHKFDRFLAPSTKSTRVLVMGTPQTPSLDAVLALHRREDVLARLAV